MLYATPQYGFMLYWGVVHLYPCFSIYRDSVIMHHVCGIEKGNFLLLCPQGLRQYMGRKRLALRGVEVTFSSSARRDRGGPRSGEGFKTLHAVGNK